MLSRGAMSGRSVRLTRPSAMLTASRCWCPRVLGVRRLLTRCEEFPSRHIGPRDRDQARMLDLLGFRNLDDLTDAAVPANIRLKKDLDIEDPVDHFITMSPKVLKQATLLRAMHCMNPQQRVALLKTADKKLIDSVFECAYNTLKEKMTLKNAQNTKLRTHKLVKRGECYKKKRRLLVQKGGAFLPLLLAPLINSVIGSLFNQ
uniref:(California timema) hypothetical protein n=1 Tax=Timema californicum TaxID=61474 RepID=A0A7R9P5Z5_TIMCA|nr:unnamed protein product [Timema californicum]